MIDLLPDPVNKDFDAIWRKLQEVGVSGWLISQEILKQGVSLQQLEDFTNQIYDNLNNISISKEWFAEFIADGMENQKQINDKTTQNVSNIESLKELIVRKMDKKS